MAYFEIHFYINDLELKTIHLLYPNQILESIFPKNNFEFDNIKINNLFFKTDFKINQTVNFRLTKL